MDYYCLSCPKPNLSFSQTYFPSTALRRPIISSRRQTLNVACGFEFGGLRAPLEPRTSIGKHVSSILLDDREGLFSNAARNALIGQAANRKEAEARVQLSQGSDEDSLHRRISHLKRQECNEAVKELMYAIILDKFLEERVYLIPKLDDCVYNSRLEILPSKDWELESIHTSEVLDLVRYHIAFVIGLRPNSSIKECWTTTVIKRGRLCSLYTTSIFYGYFLKSASLRHKLERNLKSSSLPLSDANNDSPNPVSEILSSASKEADSSTNSTSLNKVSPSVEKKHDKLRGYVMGFDPETIEMRSKPRSKEAADLIKRHSFALFNDEVTGLVEADKMICTSYASLKRFLLEGIAFGSFLWETENYVNGLYKLEDN